MTEDTAFDATIALFHERTGIVYPATRRQDAINGIRRTMSQAKIADPKTFHDRISGDSDLFARLVEQLAIAETYFFRDIPQFDEIRTWIIPDLRTRYGYDFAIRAWSAGCSTGEEAYSLAILFEQEKIPARILATDISIQALTRAKQAEYGAWSLRGEGHRAATYIDRHSNSVTIPGRLRRHVDIRVLNLIDDHYPSLTTGTSNLDLILCRNVLIYFDEETIKHVAKRLQSCLAPDGWLITGPSDPPLWEITDLTPVITSAGVLYSNAPRKQKTVPDRVVRSETRREAAIGRASSCPPQRAALAKEKVGRKEIREDHIDAVARIRGFADRGDLAQAIKVCEACIAADPTIPEFHYLRAIALLAQDRRDEAFEALRRVIYLDRSLAIAHFALGTLLARSGDDAKARRAFQRASALCEASDPDMIVPLTDGERIEGLAEAARAHIEMLDRSKSGNLHVH